MSGGQTSAAGRPPPPEGPARLASEPGGRAWLDALPRIVAECVERWSLTIGQPFIGASVSWVAPALLPSGEAAVLKVQFPHRESEHEAAALEAWRGDGAVRLLDHDPRRNALLVERCIPGAPLSTLPPDEALGVLVGMLPRLGVAPPPTVGNLSDEAARWKQSLTIHLSRCVDAPKRRLVTAALEALDRLAATQGPQVLVHQDLHGDNVLAASRQPWLAIDPKPVAAELDFAPAPIIRSAALGHGRRQVLHRLDRLSDELGLDRERAKDWAMTQTVAWSIEGDGMLKSHVDVAGWLLGA